MRRTCSPGSLRTCSTLSGRDRGVCRGVQVRVEAAADPQRLLAPTASSAADAEQRPAAFKPLHGFSTKDVLRDQRFRVRSSSGHSPLEELLCGSAIL